MNGEKKFALLVMVCSLIVAGVVYFVVPFSFDLEGHSSRLLVTGLCLLIAVLSAWILVSKDEDYEKPEIKYEVVEDETPKIS